MKNPDRFQKLIAASNTLLGRCQMSRRMGLFRRAKIQWLAADRLYKLALQ